MAKRIAVVISQGQSSNPAKRHLEEELVTALLLEPGIDVTVVPHLYDLKSDGTGILALQGISGHLVVMSWLYERAARWTLDRNGIRGTVGQTLLRLEEEDEDEEVEADEDGAESSDSNGKLRVIDTREVPQRRIYCIDLRVHNSVAPYVEEIKRIRTENNAQVVDLLSWMGGSAEPRQVERFLQPTNDTALGPKSPTPGNGNGQVLRIDSDEAERRWYPVIDYSRCTNCMECIDFCLFGVYGVDRVETILVEQPDNCRKGCPACSRVCPENAIIFPQHKTPAIAGSPVVAGSLKIDLSRLFGAPEEGKSAMEMAALERDEQLVLAGREAVGSQVIPKRQDGKEVGPKDDLDNLIDQLDELDL